MRLKYGQNDGFLRSLFSRRSKRDRKTATKRDETIDSISTLRAARGRNLPLKELEILGLATDPRRKESAPRSWYSPSESDHRLDGPAASANIPFLYPFTVTNADEDDDGRYYELDHDKDRSTLSSRQKHDAEHPPTPLLPPPPSLCLPPQQQETDSFHTKSQPHTHQEPEIGSPLSPSLSYKTFASSGIFPWGSQPQVVDDGLSDVLVLPSPPRIVKSSAYRA